MHYSAGHAPQQEDSHKCPQVGHSFPCKGNTSSCFIPSNIYIAPSSLNASTTSPSKVNLDDALVPDNSPQIFFVVDL